MIGFFGCRMHISQFQISNYKCFWQTEEIELTPGMNVVTGQNNVGKTALLQALGLNCPGVPHRSIRSLPSPSTIIDSASHFLLAFTLSRLELLEAIAGQTVRIPLPQPGEVLPGITLSNYEPGSLDAFRGWFFSQPSHTFRVQRHVAENGGTSWIAPSIPSFGILAARPPDLLQMIDCRVEPDHKTILAGHVPSVGGQEIGFQVFQKLPHMVYRFAAERFNVGQYGFGSSPVLSSQANNLPEVLGVLQGQGKVFDHFNRAVSEILPQVARITVSPEREGQTIRVWTETAYSQARPDLAFPLNDSGTGIGQVLAILYVVLTSPTPRVILIDEPQSFLHPGAARKLIEVLKSYPQHQYIVATHSPTIITAARPQTIILVKHDGNESRFEHLDNNDAVRLRGYLDEIGASLEDVFGADGIIWVEGPTEEKCFALIVEGILKKPLMGKVVKAVIATGDFAGKHAERFFEVYNKLSGAQNLIPPAVTFLFDDEGRKEDDKRSLEKLGHGLVRFTKRRMYENYLLDAQAITAVLNSTDGHTKVVSQADVQAHIDSCLDDPKNFAPLEKTRGIAWIRADVVLKSLFWKMADLDYRKTTHSVELTKWFIENDPEQLQDVSDAIRDALGWNQV